MRLLRIGFRLVASQVNISKIRTKKSNEKLENLHSQMSFLTFHGAAMLKGNGALCVLLCLLFAVLCFSQTVAAIRFDDIRIVARMPSVQAWSDSVQAIKALEEAIDDPVVRQKVRKALANTSAGFQPCVHNVYRCDDKGVIIEVNIHDLDHGRINWSKFPSTVRRINLRNSTLQQALVMTELPRDLVDFSAIDTQFMPKSVMVHPFNAKGESNAPANPCGPGNNGKCVYRLVMLECENCGLTSANFAGVAPFFPELAMLHMNGNVNMTFNVQDIPASVLSLQVSHARLGDVSVTDVLKRIPAKIERLNISYTGVRFEWDMLNAAPRSVKIMDLSGLAPPAEVGDKAGADANAQKALESICDAKKGIDPFELYFSHCGIKGGLPDFTSCQRLNVLDMSHNQLTKLSLGKLPSTLSVLHLNNNLFTESLDVAKLPRRLYSLDVSSNRMTGPIDIAALPENLEYFDISNNTFSGHVDLTKLPEKSRFVYLQHNNFTGEADLVDIPLYIRFIMIHHNNWDYRLPVE